MTGTDTFDTVSQNVTVFLEQFTEYNTTGQGPFVDGATDHLGWFRLPKNTTIFDGIADPSAGPTSPHHEMLFAVSLL